MTRRPVFSSLVTFFSTSIVCAMILIIVAPGGPEAKPPIRASFFEAYPSAVGTRLDNLPSISGHCGVCHYAFTGGGPRNLYGQQVETAIAQFPNTDAGRIQGILTLDLVDSDNDLYNNHIEILSTDFPNTPTFPGLNSTNVSQVSGVLLADILPYLTPTVAVDTTPPTVTVLTPNGGESYSANSTRTVTWTATDASGVAYIDIYLSEDGGTHYRPMLRTLANDGTEDLYVPNYPGSQNYIRVGAMDNAGNYGWDNSNAPFTIIGAPAGKVPTTLRDVDLAGAQPLTVIPFDNPNTTCVSCHGEYDASVEPYFNWKGSMMAQAMRDPLFIACLAIAEQDAPSVGDLCLRCHTPGGWLEGHSFNTSGGMVTAKDRESVQCAFCHRAVDPVYKPGVSPAADEDILNALAEVPLTTANGQYVADPSAIRRGPFADAVALHPWLESPFHRTGDMCGTCHDVSNPVFVAGSTPGDYVPNAFNAAHPDGDLRNMFPIERTYSEWENTDYAAVGVYAPQFAGNKADGIVSKCQDCHMKDVSGIGCSEPGVPTRPDLPLHDLTGGNYFIPDVLPALFPAEVNSIRLDAGKQRAIGMLQKAASLELVAENVEYFPAVKVIVTNETAHKLPSGYPEGRRIWLNVKAYDELDNLVYETGAYDPATGVLTHDEDLKIYEIHPGLSPGLAAAVGLPAGQSFHFVLNDTVYFDNRIPPRGFTNAAFETVQSPPVGYGYPDGQYWDETTYVLPTDAVFVAVTLYYQSTSKEYIEFLKNTNVTNTAGQVLYDAWVNQGRAAPVVMVHDTLSVSAIPTGVADTPRFKNGLYAAHPNPFNPSTTVPFELEGRGRVFIQVYDVNGKLTRTLLNEVKSAGKHEIAWDGRNDTGEAVASGVYFVKMKAGRFTAVQKAVLVK
jgi:hypothetical protein